MLVVADNINAMNPIVSRAMESLDPEPIQELARVCVQRGAQFIDINPGYLSRRKEDRMAFLVEAIQEVVSVRLILDSPNAGVLARGLSVCNSIPLLNALSLEPQKLNEIIPLAVEYGTPLVLLIMDAKSFTPPTMEEKIAVAVELREHCLNAGLRTEDLVFDPVLPSLSWDDAYLRISEGLRTVTLLASGAIFAEPVRTMIGLSNLRSGQERYSIKIEETCLALFAGAGLSMALMNVLRSELKPTVDIIGQIIPTAAD